MEYTKRIRIIAGPNGAGKTTFASEFLSNEANSPAFVNADMIAADLNPLHPEQSAVQAGRMMLEIIDNYVEMGESFAFETTLSGRGFARKIPKWREMGYWVVLYFLRLPSPDVAVTRVTQRTSEGGHSVPEDVVRRRYEAGWRNFQEVYKPLVDEWALYDATGQSLVLIEAGGNLMGSQDDKIFETTAQYQPTDREPEDSQPQEPPKSAELIGAEAALKRAAIKARKRAIETRGYVPTWRNGRLEYDTEV